MAQLPGNDDGAGGDYDETRSIRSNTRSLSINVNKISKVRRVGDDDARSIAISKTRDNKIQKSVD